MSPEKVRELEQRFRAIKLAASNTYGREAALVGSYCARLIAIDTYVHFLLEEVIQRPDHLEEIQRDVHETLRAFHKEICDDFGIDTQKSLEIERHFSQVTREIFTS